MQQWDENSDKVNRIRRDVEKAKALVKMVALREQRLKHMSLPIFSTLLVEDYYEIIKELITGIMSVDGWKTVSHELLIGYLAEFYRDFNQAEISLMDQLRVIRNGIAYRGVMINPEYIERNRENILSIIEKLKQVLQNKLNSGK